MKKIKYAIYCLICVLLLTGCNRKEENVLEKTHIYYMNLEETGLVAVKYKVTGETIQTKLETLIDDMKTSGDSTEYKSVFPKEDFIESIVIDNDTVLIYCDQSYYEMDAAYEVLFRAAVVQSVLQVEDFKSVLFYVDKKPLKDITGKEIGIQQMDDFVQNVGSSLHSYQTDEITLYYANDSGSKLVKEIVTVKYNSNTLYEKMILEKLVEGPKAKVIHPTIAPNTRILGVSIKEDICYVNLDNAFLTTAFSLDPKITIYSIVNSIIDGGNCKQVQILVNGETNVKYRESVDLSQPLSKNMEIVEE